jgi:hypothetical protein
MKRGIHDPVLPPALLRHRKKRAVFENPNMYAALIAALIAAASPMNSTGAVYTCATGSFHPYTNTIKYANQRRQRPVSFNGTTYQADLSEQAATNLLANGTSERFGVVWTVGTGTPTVTDAATTGVAGDTDAASFVEGSANGEQSLRQTITKAASALGYTGSIYVKNKTGSRNVVVELDDGTTTNGVSMIVNPSTGAVVSAPAAFGAGWSVLTAAMPTGYKIEAAGSYWRISLAATSDATTTIRFRVALYNGSTTSYAGDSTSGIYVWGADVCNCNWACSHISNRNFIIRSEDWSGSWTGQSISQTAAAAVNPLTGDTTATALTDAVAAAVHNYRTASIAKPAAALAMTLTVYAKADTLSWLVLKCADVGGSTNSAGAYFDLTNGVTGSDITSGAGWSVGSKAITSLGSGWYRCSVTVTTGTGAAVFAFVGLSADGLTQTYLGTGKRLYVYGAQLQYGAATTYWATNSSGPGVRAGTLQLSTATLGTTAGTMLGILIPYGWTGHYNNSTAYKIVSSQGSSGSGEIRNTSSFTSNALVCTRTDAAAFNNAVFASPTAVAITDGVPLQAAMTWEAGGATLCIDGVSAGPPQFPATVPTLPFAASTGTSVGPPVNSNQPNGYVFGMVFPTAVPEVVQLTMYGTLSAP